jgi:hypothetical protein
VRFSLARPCCPAAGLHVERQPLRDAEAADRIALHLSRVIERTLRCRGLSPTKADDWRQIPEIVRSTLRGGRRILALRAR